MRRQFLHWTQGKRGSTVFASKIHLLEHDVIKPFDTGQVNESYNLACPASPPHYQRNPVYTTKINVFGMLNMLELARRYDAKILQASTREVYGEPLIHPQGEGYDRNYCATGL